VSLTEGVNAHNFIMPVGLLIHAILCICFGSSAVVFVSLRLTAVLPIILIVAIPVESFPFPPIPSPTLHSRSYFPRKFDSNPLTFHSHC